MIHAFDVETYLIVPGNPIPRMVCGSFASEDGDIGVLLREEALDWLEEKLLAEDSIVGHNIRFDLSVAVADRPRILPTVFAAYIEGRIHDTGLRQKILDNAKGQLKYVFNEETGEFKAQRYSLADLVSKNLGIWIFGNKEGDVWRLNFSKLDGVPIEDWPQEAYNYALEDAVYTLEIFQDQLEDPHAHLLEAEWSQCQADWALQLMSVWGSRTDAEALELLRDEFQEQYDIQVENCRKYGLVRREKEKGVYKWVRNMDVIRAMVTKAYTEHDLEVPMTEGGAVEIKNPKVSTSKDTLFMRAFANIEPHPGMIAVSKLVSVGKLLSTYIPMLELGTAYPINPRYNAILETYRTSCSKPNIQNLPREGGVRNAWVARPGYVYGFCDYDTLEMRTLAQVCLWLFGESSIAEAIKDGKDLHAAFAASMLGLTYEEAMQRLEDKDPVMKTTRQGAKIANYGMAGGMGWLAFIEYARGFGVDMSEERAKELHAGFRIMWPEMTHYFYHCGQQVDDKDDDSGINQIVFPISDFIRGDVRYTQICNGYFQNLAAMGAKKALFDVAVLCYTDKSSPLYGCRPWLFAHDEIGLEVPFDGTEAGRKKASAAMAELERVMKEAMEFFVPDVPIGATGALCFSWIKGAKPMFREINGEQVLVPCVQESSYMVDGEEHEGDWVEDFQRNAA